MARQKALLVDVNYAFGEKSIIQLYFSNGKEQFVVKDPSFEPYFYVITKGDIEENRKLLEETNLGGVKPRRVEIVERKTSPEKEPEKVLQVFLNSTKDVKPAREHVKELEFVLQKREFDIPFAKRYLIDKGLEPLSEYEVEFNEENELVSLNKLDKPRELRIGAFDLETYFDGGFSNAKKDPIIMASYADFEEQVVFSTKKIAKKYAVQVKDEKELVEKLAEKIRSKKLDILCTYNGDRFDLPYLKDRAEILGVNLRLGADDRAPRLVKKGLDNAVGINGVQHVDAYQLLRILNKFAIVNLIKFDLETVDKALYGEDKEKIQPDEMIKIWNSGKDLERFAEYNRLDSEVTYRIVKDYIPLYVEVGKLVKQTLFDITRAGASQLVESLLLIEAFEKKILVPNKPHEQEVKMRLMRSIKGGFVKEPVPGLHENLAIVDFTSLHPTIMISHNISPDTVGCDHAECKENVSPGKQQFCTKRKGFISETMKELFGRRYELKKSLKDLKKGSKEYTTVHAKQQGMKIILNSFYGTLAFARFRWYSFESAGAVTSWSRQYVKMVAEKAEKAGFVPIYGDTDSAFLKIPEGKTREDVHAFLKKINSELPGVMSLDLDGFYKRGIFVTTKSGEKAAKKKYALIDFDGNLKIVGFEYVRRDWSRIARETQRSVIEAVLSEGNPEKAVRIAKRAISDLKAGSVKKSDLVIFSRLKRPIEKYESIGPHVAAARKAIAKGKALGEGSMIDYVITRAGKSISDRAQLAEFVAEGNYDADYYIGHQVIPAVIKIIRELGYSKEDLIHGGKQSSLAAFG